MSVVYLDGQYIPDDRAMISVNDRGFLFGDGIYEVTRAVDGRLFALDRHLARLAHGLAGLEIQRPLQDSDLMELHGCLLAENELVSGDATVYIQITRGTAPRAHAFPPATTRPTVYAFAAPLAVNHEQRERGAGAVTYPDIRWARCDLKTVNLLPSVLARQFAKSRGAIEALFIRDGAITEGSHTNVFGVIDGELRTYPASTYILPGVTRTVVLDLARELGIRVREMPVLQTEIPSLQELFVTGTTSDVTPITSLDEQPIGGGRPGPITTRLRDAFAETLRATRG